MPGPPPPGLGGAGGVCSPNSPGVHTANLGLLGLPGPELNAPPPYPHLGKKPDYTLFHATRVGPLGSTAPLFTLGKTKA